MMRDTWFALRSGTISLREEIAWKRKGFRTPAPYSVKWKVLMRHSRPEDAWVETGTFTGETAAFLASHGCRVHTIEPDDHLARLASSRFSANPLVTVHHGTSEMLFATVLADIEGPCSVWLDGHYSGEGTYRGVRDTPVLSELEAVGVRLSGGYPTTVFVDDFRCFPPGPVAEPTYPRKDAILEVISSWGVDWEIEHDILVATSR